MEANKILQIGSNFLTLSDWLWLIAARVRLAELLPSVFPFILCSSSWFQCHKQQIKLSVMSTKRAYKKVQQKQLHRQGSLCITEPSSWAKSSVDFLVFKLLWDSKEAKLIKVSSLHSGLDRVRFLDSELWTMDSRVSSDWPHECFVEGVWSTSTSRWPSIAASCSPLSHAISVASYFGLNYANSPPKNIKRWVWKHF